MVTRFNPSSEQSARALQAYQILISSAMNRQTHTYKSLSELMYRKPAQGVLADILGHIAYYCNDNDLPPLTVLVVNEKTGLPGSGIPIDEGLNATRERVFKCDWYDLYPPTVQE